VLAIHWGPPDFPSTPTVNDAIKGALSADGAPVDYFAEYLESDRVPAEDASQSLADHIRGKYRGRRIDVVLAIADPALRFVVERPGVATAAPDGVGAAAAAQRGNRGRVGRRFGVLPAAREFGAVL
jgi:hypothetical protein